MEKKPLILENGQLKEMSSSDTIPIQNLGSGSVDSTKYLRADGKWVTPPAGAGLADGDKGDITVSGGGTIWTIDNLAVTDAKINDVAATKVTEDTTHRFATDAEKTSWNSKEPGITAGTTGQYWRGDKSWQTLDKTAVGLGNVVNADTTTTANITDSLNKRFITDAQQTVLGNTSGTNSGDNAVNTLYSGLATSKQDTLVSGTNIKTINGSSILGSGDLTVSGSGLQQFEVRRMLRR